MVCEQAGRSTSPFCGPHVQKDAAAILLADARLMCPEANSASEHMIPRWLSSCRAPSSQTGIPDIAQLCSKGQYLSSCSAVPWWRGVCRLW